MGYESITHHIWEEQRKQIKAKYLGKPLITFKRDAEGKYFYEISEEGEKCHFLQFLQNASNFTWRKPAQEVESDENAENKMHLLSKLCAIGF